MRPFVTKRALLLTAILLVGAATAGAQIYGRSPQQGSRGDDRGQARFVAPDGLDPHSFYFTRARYSGGGRGFRRGDSWATDYPKAEDTALIKAVSGLRQAYSSCFAARTTKTSDKSVGLWRCYIVSF